MLQQREFLLEELKRLQGNFSKLAREQGLDYFVLKTELMGSETEYEVIKRPDYPMPDDIGSLAKYPSWKSYVIAVKENGTVWPEKFQKAIKNAQDLLDEGRVIMCQSKHPDGWVVLYSIPRKQRALKPKPFFSVDWSAK